MTGHISLPLPDAQILSLPLTLSLVTAIEERHGSLFALAEGVLQKSLMLSAMVDILHTAYRHGGCGMEDDTRAAFLLAARPAALVADMLTRIIDPLQYLGAVEDAAAGKPHPPAASR